MFISLEGRRITHNPLYKAFKSKSFTDKDITLHFILMDILVSGESYTLNELIQIIGDEYLSVFDNPLSFDELDPYKCLLNQINSERYDAVEKMIS
ncbi:MAG: hypothetical protein II193_09730 [Lachnospiraceae bacterium]|nr:hypothetical protein [Lachnospiraceae bacterium]